MRSAANFDFAPVNETAPAPFRDLAARFLRAKQVAVEAGDLRSKTLDGYQGLLRRYILPELGELPWRSVARADLTRAQSAILRRVAKPGASGATTARQALTLISMIYNWAIDNDLAAFNPADRVRFLARPAVRDRLLSSSELRAVWRTLSTAEGRAAAGVGEPVSIALRLSMLTLLRRSSVIGLRHGEIDCDNALWTVPASRMKSKRAFVAPLSPPALELIDRAYALQKRKSPAAPGDAVAFPARNGSGPMAGAALTRAMGRVSAAIGIPAAGPNDLRRTGRALLSGPVGVSFEIAESCVDHDVRDLTGQGDAASRLSERRRAILGLSREIARIAEARP